MNKESINQRFIEAVRNLLQDKGLTKASIAANLGVKPSKFSEILNNRMMAGTDMIDSLCEKYSYSPIWLLVGEGPMLIPGYLKGRSKPAIALGVLSEPIPEDVQKEFKRTAAVNKKSISDKKELVETGDPKKGIPLVSQTVAAGFGNENFAITEDDVKDYYVIPRFKHRRIDFMIEVTGDSMIPHLNAGDIIACTIIQDSQFIQWNHTHVIATREQGLLVKRLVPSENDGCLKAVSDNPKYPPFNIPKDEITGIALVVGSVRLE